MILGKECYRLLAGRQPNIKATRLKPLLANSSLDHSHAAMWSCGKERQS